MPAVERTVEIVNLRGLHARAAAKFVKAAGARNAKINVMKDDMCVCGTSIMGLLMLAAGKNTRIRIAAEGEEAQTALDELAALVESRFGEEA